MNSQESDTASLTLLQKLLQPFKIAIGLQCCGSADGNPLVSKRLHTLLEELHDLLDWEFRCGGFTVGEEVCCSLCHLCRGVFGEGAVGIGVGVVILGDELDA